MQSITQKKFGASWQSKEGVFKTNYGKWIARVFKNGHYTTLSQHKTKEEAEKVYNDFKNNQ